MGDRGKKKKRESTFDWKKFSDKREDDKSKWAKVSDEGRMTMLWQSLGEVQLFLAAIISELSRRTDAD